MSSYESNPYIYLAKRSTTSTLRVVRVEEVRNISLYILYMLESYLFVGGLEHRVKDGTDLRREDLGLC